MELQTISQVSKAYDISSRMLRYYEQIGLIQSIRNMDILNKHRKPGAPILTFGSLDMDAQIRGGGHRDSVCLVEADIAGVDAFMKHYPYVRTIDASRWLIFERKKSDSFNDHSICMKLGYIWNGTISGSFMVWPDGKVGSEKEPGSIVYSWYPVKYGG